MAKRIVVESVNNDSVDRCVDFYALDDGTFGYEVFRRDVEDQQGWFSTNRGALPFGSIEEAISAALEAVPWLTAAMSKAAAWPSNRQS